MINFIHTKRKITMAIPAKKTAQAGYIIGLIVYIITGLFFFLAALGTFGAAAETNLEYEGTIFIYIGMVATTLFIAVSLWFISFSVGFRQRQKQIELLKEIAYGKE